MTEGKLDALKAQYHRLGILSNALDLSERLSNPREKLTTLIDGVSGHLNVETLLQCYNLIRPELEAVRRQLQKEWDEA